MAARHITMIALGGAIGAGLFKGSSSAIAAAGPSVLIAYFIGGIVPVSYTHLTLPTIASV